MKKKLLVYYLDLMKSAQDKEEWITEKRYGELALKKLSNLSCSPYEKYLLYYRLGNAHSKLAEYSRSLDVYYKARLIASKHRLNPAYSAYISYSIGYNFLNTRNLNQALLQFLSVEAYYQKNGDGVFPMDKSLYFNNCICLGCCYLNKNNLQQVHEIIDKRLAPYVPFNNQESILKNYYYLKGGYLKEKKEYERSRQSFQECIKLSEKSRDIPTILDSKLNLAIIDLLEGQWQTAVQAMTVLIGAAKRLKINDYICGINLILSKCYLIKNMPDKAVFIDKQIKPYLNKVDINWFYAVTRESELLYQQLQPIYQNRISVSTPEVISNKILEYSQALSETNAIIGKSIPMLEVFQLINRIAPTDLPVLIQGETGTGKELVARAIHNNSARKGKIWLALNCGAGAETLLENELFGHTKGAYTDAYVSKKGHIELASEGTLFLDEIADMSPSMQQKLLRVMDEKIVWRLGSEKPVAIDTRFIFSGNRNIEELVKARKFREDLFYRINTFVIILPPLRDRKEDIPLLVNHFIKKIGESKKIEKEALKLLIDYNWPGNIRELENEIKRICALYPNANLITEVMISGIIKQYSASDGSVIRKNLSLNDKIDTYERSIIEEALKACQWNISRAAVILHCDRASLHRKIKRLKL